MGSIVVGRSSGRNECCLACVEKCLDANCTGMKPELVVHPKGGRVGNGHTRAKSLIGAVVKGTKEGKPIGSTAQENVDDDVA